MDRGQLQKIIIIYGITDNYSWTISRNIHRELHHAVEEFKNLVLVESDDLVYKYRNQKPSQVERDPDYNYAYIVDPNGNLVGFYQIVD